MTYGFQNKWKIKWQSVKKEKIVKANLFFMTLRLSWISFLFFFLETIVDLQKKENVLFHCDYHLFTIPLDIVAQRWLLQHGRRRCV